MWGRGGPLILGRPRRRTLLGDPPGPPAAREYFALRGGSLQGGFQELARPCRSSGALRCRFCRSGRRATWWDSDPAWSLVGEGAEAVGGITDEPAMDWAGSIVRDVRVVTSGERIGSYVRIH